VSTLWTPRGEHRVPQAPNEGQSGPSDVGPGQGGQAGNDGTGRAGPATNPGGNPQGGGPFKLADDGGPTPEEVEEAETELDAMRAQLLEAPVEVVIANHAMGLWELAALHLSNRPPNLGQAQLAIDALTALVDGLRGRLGEPEKTLDEGLSQLRMAFVQIRQAEHSRLTGTGGSGPPTS
jgi:Domain of unknown function (DUF1844)